MAVGSLIQPRNFKFLDTTNVGTSDAKTGSTAPHGAVGDKRGPLRPRDFKGQAIAQVSSAPIYVSFRGTHTCEPYM